MAEPTTREQIDEHLTHIARELDAIGERLEADLTEKLPEIRKEALKQADSLLAAFDRFVGNARQKLGELEQAETSQKEAYSWSSLRPLVRAYMEQIEKGDKTGRFFAYGGLIKNPVGVKPEPDTQPANEEASLQGYSVGMNLFASGPQELRGTNRPDLGIVNTGLYAGLENDPSGTSQGLNLTVKAADFAKAFEAYARAELGEPPYPEFFADLFSNKPLEKLPAIEPEKDGLLLYKMIVGTARTHQGREVPVLSTATNERGPLSAIGLTPLQAAYYILDGIGFVRAQENGGRIGGSALDYFTGIMHIQAEHGFSQPKLEETARAVQALAEHIYEAHYAAALLEHIQRETENASVVDAAQQLARMAVRLTLEKTRDITVREFDPAIAQPRSEVSPQELEFQLTLMPKNDVEKVKRISGIVTGWHTNPNFMPGIEVANADVSMELPGPYAKGFDGLLTNEVITEKGAAQPVAPESEQLSSNHAEIPKDRSVADVAVDEETTAVVDNPAQRGGSK